VWGNVQDAAFMILSKLVVFNDKLAILDDIAGRAEHLFLILVFFVEGEIRIRPDPKMTLMLEAKRSRWTRPGDDGDLLERILTAEIRQYCLAYRPLIHPADLFVTKLPIHQQPDQARIHHERAAVGMVGREYEPPRIFG